MGMQELAIVAVVVVLLFGPQLVRRIGASIAEMRRLSKGGDDEQA